MDQVGELAAAALATAGYGVQTVCAHLGDPPAPADPDLDLTDDNVWILCAPAVGQRRAAG